MEEAPSHQRYFITTSRKILQNFLQYTGVWKSVVDGYIPSKRVKSTAQKEAKRNNALALEIIQKTLSKAMRNEMKTITSAKEMWLSLEQIYKENDREDDLKSVKMIMEDKSNDIKRQWKKCKSFEELEELVFEVQQLKLKELEELKESSNTGKYTGNISKPPIDFIEKDCSKVERCFHNDYNFESDNSDNLSYLDDRVNIYIKSESESENEKSTCYSIDMPGYTGSDFRDHECDRNLEDVKSNVMFVFERLSKNKQVNGFRENIMFVLDKINNLQE